MAEVILSMEEMFIKIFIAKLSLCICPHSGFWLLLEGLNGQKQYSMPLISWYEHDAGSHMFNKIAFN